MNEIGSKGDQCRRRGDITPKGTHTSGTEWTQQFQNMDSNKPKI